MSALFNTISSVGEASRYIYSAGEGSAARAQLTGILCIPSKSVLSLLVSTTAKEPLPLRKNEFSPRSAYHSRFIQFVSHLKRKLVYFAKS